MFTLKTTKGWKLKRFLSLALIINLLSMPVLALEFDTSLDDEVRKNYNPSKLEEDMTLPTLPKILDKNTTQLTTKALQPVSRTTPSAAKATQPITRTNQASATVNDLQAIPNMSSELQYKRQFRQSTNSNYATLRQGKRIKLKVLNDISDWSKKGTRVTFMSTRPISTTYFTIPNGTIFKGEIINSHRPQLTGNGGLVEININSVIINNEVHPISAFVTKADHKMIFFNNIKGKRKYIKNTFNSMRPGGRFFKKMIGVTVDLACDGSSIILAPFSLALGVIGFAGDILISPVLGSFYKGEGIQIHQGSEFEIKLKQDMYIYN